MQYTQVLEIGSCREAMWHAGLPGETTTSYNDLWPRRLGCSPAVSQLVRVDQWKMKLNDPAACICKLERLHCHLYALTRATPVPLVQYGSGLCYLSEACVHSDVRSSA